MKVYEKPRVYIERFELTQHIATCAFDMKNATVQAHCMAISEDMGDPMSLFMKAEGCDIFPKDDSDVALDAFFEEYCYTNGASGNNIFNS